MLISCRRDINSAVCSQEIVEDGNHMTFDYMALLAVASTIAGAGLLSDSPTAVIASMLGVSALDELHLTEPHSYAPLCVCLFACYFVRPSVC